MTTHERNLRTDFDVATDDDDPVSVEHDQADLLFSPEDRVRFGQRWTDIQNRFVDDPHDAVESADDLVTEMMDRIGDRLAECRTGGQALAGEGETETENLRLATQRYRAIFHRLLST